MHYIIRIDCQVAYLRQFFFQNAWPWQPLVSETRWQVIHTQNWKQTIFTQLWQIQQLFYPAQVVQITLKWKYRGAPEAWFASMLTIKFWNELPTFKRWLESSLARFLAHAFIDGPRQQRAFWADLAPFADTGGFIVIQGNYQGTRL